MEMLFICNPQQRAFFDFPGVIAISSREELDNIYVRGAGSPSWRGIVIMTELLWEKTNYSDFYGLAIVHELRSAYGEQAPILITSYSSFLDEDALKFLPSIHPRFKCFFDPAVRYVPLRILRSIASAGELASLLRAA